MTTGKPTSHKNKATYTSWFEANLGSGSQIAVAEALKQSGQALSQSLTRGLSYKKALRIAKAMGWPSPTPGYLQLAVNKPVNSITLAFLSDTLGFSSAIGINEVLEGITVRKDWLERKYPTVDTTKIGLITMVDDSMAPVHNQGEVLLLDTAVTEMQQDGVYLLEYAGQVVVRWVEHEIVGGAVDVVSYGQPSGRRRVEQEDLASVRVCGAVIGSLQFKLAGGGGGSRKEP